MLFLIIYFISKSICAFLRILRLRETGLVGEWEKRYVPSASKCMKINERKGISRLSLKHLSSAFVILIGGCLISLAAFIVEKLARFRRAMRVVVV